MRTRALATLLALAALFAAPAAASSTTASRRDDFIDRQWGLKKIAARAAWDTTRGRGALIAIVDTGVDLGHPDLRDRIVHGAGKDFVDPQGSDGPQDEHGHGTHVAGIAAATARNGIGVAGVAPRARILPVRVLDADGSGTTGDVAAGIEYAANRGADVINLSLGVGGPASVLSILGGDAQLAAAIEFAWSKGSVVVAAAGNDALPFCSQPSDASDVVCVGATGPDDELSPFSNSTLLGDANYVVAPGGTGESCAEDILSTMLRSVPRDDCSPARGYTAFAGTSMATPFVAGAAALLASRGLGNDAIVTCLLQTADDLGPEGRDATFGSGRVNARRAVRSC